MKIIDKNIFEELNKLMMLKKDYQIFSTNLKSKPYINKISLSKGSVEIYLDDNDIEYLIKYYEEKIEKINEKLSKFSLTKLNDEIEIIEEDKEFEDIREIRGEVERDKTLSHDENQDGIVKNFNMLIKWVNLLVRNQKRIINEINKLKGEK